VWISWSRTFTTCSSPALELRAHVGRERLVRLVRERLRLGELGGHLGEPLGAPRLLDEVLGALVVVAHGLRDLREVAGALGRQHLLDPRRLAGRHRGERARAGRQAVVDEEPAQELVERGHAVVVERRRRRAEHRHVLRPLAERLAVADQLAGDLTHRVLGAASLELVDGDRVGEVEHVDLLELRGGAVLRRHDVEAGVDERHHRGVALTDARRLDDDQVEARRIGNGDDVAQVVGQLVGAAGGEAAEEHAVAVEAGALQVEAVHADPVAEQRAAAAAPGRVDGEHGDPQLVVLVDPQSP
jgi:hypothetical protein